MRTHWILAATALLACSCAATGETRRFAVQNEYSIEVPAGTHELQAWFAVPADDESLQSVAAFESRLTPAGAGTLTEVRDEHGNRFLHFSGSELGGQTVRLVTSFELERREAHHSTDPSKTRALTPAEKVEFAAYLAPSSNILLTTDVRQRAAEIVGNEQNPVVQARLLYDWVLNNVTYWVKHPDTMKASGVGSSTYCMDERCGNCTDFHSGYAALARAAGLPVRMIYGSFFKGPLNGENKDQSYHCWIEFWAPRLGWTPLDVAIADIFVDDFELDDVNRTPVSLTVADGYAGPDPALVEYYFGNLDARRVTWNRGRDLVLPGARGGPVNAMPKAHVEADGTPVSSWTRTLTFAEL